MKPDVETKLLLDAAIAAHLKAHGSKSWDILLSKFPNLSQSTVWRRIRKTKKRLDTVIEQGEILHAPNELENGCTMAPDLLEEPAPPVSWCFSSIHLTNTELAKLRAGADQLEAESKRLKDGVPVITNATLFTKSLDMRRKALDLYARHEQNFALDNEIQEFFRAIVDEIGQDSRECTIRIMLRLARLNKVDISNYAHLLSS